MATILVVDDDADVLEALAAIVESGGHQVAKARSGAAALEILGSKIEFDLMLTDIMMPGLDGFRLARAARALRGNLRILYMSGYHELTAAMRGPAEPLGKLLSKPLRAAYLRQEVDAALRVRVPI